MSKIKYEIFDGECEALKHEQDASDILELVFSEQLDGFISLDGVVVRLTDGRARVDLRYVSDGEYTPYVILKNARLALPKIKKLGRHITLTECDADYARRTSIRERRLSRRVSELEKEIEQLKACIYGTKII